MAEPATTLLNHRTDEVLDADDDAARADASQPVVAADLLVEEVSIDGMCGVY